MRREGNYERWKKQVPPQQRQKRGKVQERQGVSVVGSLVGVGGHLCCPQTLNITVFQYIFQRGSPLITYVDPPTTTLIFYSSSVLIQSLCPSLIFHPILMHPTVSVYVSQCLSPSHLKVYLHLPQTILYILLTKLSTYSQNWNSPGNYNLHLQIKTFFVFKKKPEEVIMAKFGNKWSITV